MMLITVEDAMRHLRLDDDFEYSLIEVYIQAASNAIMNYLNGGNPWRLVRDEFGRQVLDECGEVQYQRDDNCALIPEPAIANACRILVADWYRNREGSNKSVSVESGYGFLPDSVVALCIPYRKMVMR